MSEGPGAEQRIEYMRLDDLVPAERNTRTHDLGAIGGAIDELGFTSEFKLDEASGRLIRGHGRLAELRRKRDKGAEAPEWIRDAGDDWLVPVVRGWSSRGKLHADAVREADNTIAQTGGFDAQAELDVLADLAAEAPNLLRGVGRDSAYLDRLLESVGTRPDGATVTDLDGLGDALAPWDREPDDRRDPFDRPEPPERDGDEQWDPGRTVVDPEDRPEPAGPGPLDVAPAIRTLQPWRFVFHLGGPDGARQVMDWLKGHATDIRAEDGDVVLWRDADGEWQLLPGRWCTRDGQTGAFDTWTDEEFHARFVPANEPARRAFKKAADSRVNARDQQNGDE